MAETLVSNPLHARQSQLVSFCCPDAHVALDVSLLCRAETYLLDCNPFIMPECAATSGFTSQLVEHIEKRPGLSGITLSPGFFMLTFHEIARQQQRRENDLREADGNAGDKE
jgi:hypothetical protein